MESEKRPYVPPEMVKLGGVQAGEGMRQCAPGSGDLGNCVSSGSSAGMACNPTGSAALGACITGSAVAA